MCGILLYRSDNDSKDWGLKPVLQDGHHTLRWVLTGFRKSSPFSGRVPLSYIQNLVSSDELQDIPISQFITVSKACRKYVAVWVRMSKSHAASQPAYRSAVLSPGHTWTIPRGTLESASQSSFQKPKMFSCRALDIGARDVANVAGTAV